MCPAGQQHRQHSTDGNLWKYVSYFAGTMGSHGFLQSQILPTTLPEIRAAMLTCGIGLFRLGLEIS